MSHLVSIMRSVFWCRWLLVWVFVMASGIAVCAAQVIRVEAETATLEGPNVRVAGPAANSVAGAKLPAAVKFSGTGYLTGFVTEADRATLAFQLDRGGFYRVAMAYHCEKKRGYAVAVNGLGLAGVFAASSGAAFGVQDIGEVELPAGANQVTIQRGWGFVDYDYLQLTPVGPPGAPRRPMAAAADPAVAPAARSLLQRLDDSYGKTTLLGVYSNTDADYVLQTTGKRPAVMGGDLIDYSPQRALHQRKPNLEVERLIEDARQGYMVTLCWHWASPSGQKDTAAEPWWKSFYTEATTYDLAQVLSEPDGKEYALMLSDIDAIAVQLRRLQDAGIPVLWRPLHEASGGWFWWGARGPAAFIQLWQILFDRLTRVDGLHNLIWVYTSDGDPQWYPGDKYVDVIGIDAYPKDLRDPQNTLWSLLEQRHAGSKPLTISEFGGVPDVPEMQRLGEFWSYAVSWNGSEGPRKNSEEEVRRVYSHPGAGTLPAPAAPGTPGIGMAAAAGPGAVATPAPSGSAGDRKGR